MEIIHTELKRTGEFKMLLEQDQFFPNEESLNIVREIKLLGLPGAMLSEEQFLLIRKLAEALRKIFHGSIGNGDWPIRRWLRL